MKKRYKSLIGVLLGVFICIIAVIVYVLSLLTPAPMDEQIISNDRFTIVTKIQEINDIDFITFHVQDIEGNIVFSCTDSWRCWDFKEIRFIDDTNNIYVNSSDTGETIYTFDSNTHNNLTNDSGNWSKNQQLYLENENIKTLPYLNEIINQQQGYINISNSEFIEKAKKVDYTMFGSDLVEIYGVEGYNDPYVSGLDVYYCFNDNYLLRIVRGGSVVLYNIYTNEHITLIQSDDNQK